MRAIIILLYTLLTTACSAFANDSIPTLSPESFLQIVKMFHPIAKQASIQIDKAKADLLMARSSFDPVLASDGKNKLFDGINYYQNNSFQINIPTWYGIEVQSGIEYLTGGRTNPQETSGKTSFVSISLPLAKNLLMDKRRAVLQQSKIMVTASEQEMKIMLNDLLIEAADSYWQWAQSYFVYNMYNHVIDINRKRFEMVVASFRNGEKAAIDTTEALTQLQTFEYLQNEAMLNWQNATINLSGYLWKDNNETYNLPFFTIKPNSRIEELYDPVIQPELEPLLTSAKLNHPELLLLKNNLKVLSIEKKLKFQDLLPELDIKYNQLGKGYNVLSTATKPLFDNNYRFAVNFSMPLRLSQGRGSYRSVKLKISETQLDFNNKELIVLNKIKYNYNQQLTYKKQVNLLQKTYANFKLLQRGEENRFFNGESSLFLVNSRENKALEALLKLTETAIDYNKSIYILKWSAGELWNF